MNNNCEKCNSNDQLILHNVIISPKSSPKKFCNSCVLRHYHKSICAQCYQLYDPIDLNPPQLSTAITGINRLLPCIRCDNWSHFNCPKPNVPKSPYICPSCMSPNYKYFDFKSSGNNGGDLKMGFGEDAAKQLLGAARIAVVTVAKEVMVARGEVERRVKEAAVARKDASEAIDVVRAVMVENVRPNGMLSKAVNYTPVSVERSGASNAEVKNGAVDTVPVVLPFHGVNNGGVSVGNGGVRTESSN